MILIWILLLISCHTTTLAGKKIAKHTTTLLSKVQKVHHDVKHVRRFNIPKHLSPADNPALNDDGPEEFSNIVTKPNKGSIHETELPGAFGEEGDIDEESGSGSGEGKENAVKPTTTSKPSFIHHPHKPETAARFGNNWHLEPGINPSAAFVTQKLNHKGFKGHDKDVRQRYKKTKNNHNNENNKKTKKITKVEVDKQLANYLKKVDKEYAEQGENDENENKNEDGGDDEKSSVTDNSNSVHSEDAVIMKQIENIAEEIKKVEKKRKEKEKENRISSSDNGKNSNSLYPHTTEKKGSDAFACPWSCFWTCQSYCPRECCDNPYNCSTACREICTPYCKDECCAPGAKRLPKLRIPLLPARSTAENNKKDLGSNAEKGRNDELVSKIKALKAASEYTVQLLGVPKNLCPAFCSNICAPSMCKPSCCEKRTMSLNNGAPYQQPVTANSQQNNIRREDFLKSYPTLPQQVVAPFQTNSIADRNTAKTNVISPSQQQQQQAYIGDRSVFCATVQNCPPGSIVSSNYCPPICRSSCIQQCPNECCSRRAA